VQSEAETHETESRALNWGTGAGAAGVTGEAVPADGAASEKAPTVARMSSIDVAREHRGLNLGSTGMNGHDPVLDYMRKDWPPLVEIGRGRGGLNLIGTKARTVRLGLGSGSVRRVRSRSRFESPSRALPA
jgi:hypothetical protein